MPTIHIDAGVVGFSADERTVTGLLLPYGEQCSSSVGKFAFSPGVCELPEDPTVTGLNVQHQREHPVGRATTITETPRGVVASFKIADGKDGDQALADIASGKRKHLSAEVRELVVDGARAVKAQLFGAALVEKPAFPGAVLFAYDESGEPEIEPDEADKAETTEKHVDEWQDEDGRTWKRTTSTTTVVDGTTTTTTTKVVLEEPEPAGDTTNEPEEGNTMATATAQGFAAASHTPGKTEPRKTDKAAFFSAVADAVRTGDERHLANILRTERLGMFALADVKYDAAATDGGKLYEPAYLGDVWEGNPFERELIPLLSHGDLTELNFKQRRITQRPLVDKWTGNKTEIPSQAPKFTTETKQAQRFAGGLDIAREYLDFGHTADIEYVVGLMVESYKINSDAYVRDEIVAASTELELTAADKPADISEALWKLVKGALAVRRQGKAKATFAVVDENLFEELLFTKKDNSLEYLATSVGLDAGTLDGFSFVPTEHFTDGEVLVGARQAATVLELPGSPIRVNALDIARGGIDEALFGYVGVRVERAEALQLVTTAAAAE